MIWIVAAREILDNLMSLKFLFGTVLCLVLVVISTVVSLQDYQSRIDDYDSTLAELDEQSYFWRVIIHRRPEVLSIFARGFDDRLGNIAYSRPSNLVPGVSSLIGAEESGHLAAELASIDFVFVVRVILSLLAIFLAYDAVSGEYERGTLKLMLSRPVPRASIILGKLMAGAICLLIPLTTSFIIGILIIQSADGMQSFTSEDWLRVSSIFGIAILCVMGFYMLGLVVSCRTRQAATSLLILLLIWIAGIFLIPGLSTAAVERYRLATRHPSRGIIAILQDFWQSNPRPDRREMDRDVWVKRMVEWDELLDQVNYRIWNLTKQYFDRLYSQADLVRWICRLSPSESCAYAAEAMARTDVEAYRTFMRYARSYHRRHSRQVSTFWEDRSKIDTEEYGKAIQAPPIDLSTSLRAAAPDICLLVIFNVLFFMLSILFFLKYDVH